jgi:hypothetical protein
MTNPVHLVLYNGEEIRAGSRKEGIRPWKKRSRAIRSSGFFTSTTSSSMETSEEP